MALTFSGKKKIKDQILWGLVFFQYLFIYEGCFGPLSTQWGRQNSNINKLILLFCLPHWISPNVRQVSLFIFCFWKKEKQAQISGNSTYAGLPVKTAAQFSIVLSLFFLLLYNEFAIWIFIFDWNVFIETKVCLPCFRESASRFLQRVTKIFRRLKQAFEGNNLQQLLYPGSECYWNWRFHLVQV